MIIIGDVNGDGRITIDDLIEIEKHMINIKELKGDAFTAADVNHDGEVDILDYSRILLHLYGNNIINEVVE